MKIPQHVAIILDGNGRWAKSKGMPRNYGHTVGAKNVETVCQAAHDMGIKYLTLYAFSTENWNRPDNEVNALMKLLESYLKNCIKTADKNNMRVRVIGDTTKLSEKFQNQIKELESASAHNDGLNLQIAIIMEAGMRCSGACGKCMQISVTANCRKTRLMRHILKLIWIRKIFRIRIC